MMVLLLIFLEMLLVSEVEELLYICLFLEWAGIEQLTQQSIDEQSHYVRLWDERFFKLNQTAKSIGYIITRRATDGNCYFSCLLECLNTSNETIFSLRNQFLKNLKIAFIKNNTTFSHGMCPSSILFLLSRDKTFNSPLYYTGT